MALGQDTSLLSIPPIDQHLVPDRQHRLSVSDSIRNEENRASFADRMRSALDEQLIFEQWNVDRQLTVYSYSDRQLENERKRINNGCEKGQDTRVHTVGHSI